MLFSRTNSFSRNGQVAGRLLAILGFGVLLPTVVIVQWKHVEVQKQRNVADALGEIGASVEWSSTNADDSHTNGRTLSILDFLAKPLFQEIVAADLSKTEVTDDQLATLSQLDGLRKLNLRDTSVTDAALTQLQELKHLKQIDLRDTDVSAEGVAQLRDALPTATILYRARSKAIEVPTRDVAFERRSLRKTLPPGPVGSGLGHKVEIFVDRAKRDTVVTGQRPEASTLNAVELGLTFLARQQHADGRWPFRGVDDIGEIEATLLSSDVAATGLALLAFLGAGIDQSDDRYGERVSRGLDYLIQGQKSNGDLYVPTDQASSGSMWLYSHGIASIALCEAYGMTKSADLETPAQRAIDFIVASQHPELGGWRYSPNVSSDTSVTGWLAMALHSARQAELAVPETSLQSINNWLDFVQASRDEPHLYVYNPNAPDTNQQRHGRHPNPTMTSVGLLMRLYLGWDKSDPRILRGAEYLSQFPPSNGTVESPLRDSYYWYYATQVLLHVGGERWNQWNEQIHPLLVESQIPNGAMAGSWDPIQPVPDRWGKHAGRIYITSLNLLTLEVYFRHLPIYDVAASSRN